MKHFFLFFVLIIYSCKPFAQTTSNPNKDTVLFAKFKKDKLEYKIDTASFKLKVANNIFSKESDVIYDKLEISRQTTLGNDEFEYYFVLLQDFDKSLKTVRYLRKSGIYFYLDNKTNFNKLYLSCVGKKKKCSPNVIITKNAEMGWICSNKIGVCSIDSTECKAFKTLVVQ